ncbi:PREDICTED: triggering receptor expressed on myeloid cells 1 isoform X1 [Myotis brandtii]|uniref:triggering receptor expressed on myeloid cells 1 isoform X1 n=1 Tax=Myotis brandtii TaxID=109478 RepID=UPI0007047457|nr:PREDICTED: triggering receptor expressed on myeloid cells 1 isoform X1 [Myotis brandtii]
MDRMDRTGLWGRPRLLLLLLLLWVSGLRGEDEEQMCLLEGSNLTISCLCTRQYASSLKAWQRVRSRGPPETLVRTDTRNADLNLAQARRYLLEDDPTEVTFRVSVRELQRQDVGLYQCVIDLSPRTPVVLPPWIRLVPCEGLPPALALSELQVMAIVLTCGFVLNKGLVFSVLFVLLRKARASGEPNPGEQQSHPSRS